jgi:hypothetical protein
MVSGGPYRSASLVVIPEMREVVRCDWCAWSKIIHATYECSGPPLGTGKPFMLNANGDCVYYRDSFTTKVLRKFGLRSAALVRVADGEAKPDNSPREGLGRNGGSGGRGGNVSGGPLHRTGLTIGKRMD